jgi:hypothetical protein
MPERTAAIIWIGINSVLVLTAVLIAAKEVVARWPIENTPAASLSIAGVALILNIDKVRSLLNLGQSDGLMLLAFACVLSWMERKPIWAGVAVGLSANIKYLSLIFVPYFLIKRNYRAVVAAVVSFGTFMLLPAVEVGFTRGAEYISVATSGLGKMMGIKSSLAAADIFDVEWNRSVSITSTMFRLSRSHGWSDVVAVVGALLLFTAVIAIIVLICRACGVAIFRPTNNEKSKSNAVAILEWVVLIFVALAFSPQTTSRHMVLMTLVYVVGVALLLIQSERTPRVLLICATALMVGALTLPPYGIGVDQVVWTWRKIGGASWCALIFVLALVWVGRRTISAKLHVDLGGRSDQTSP